MILKQGSNRVAFRDETARRDIVLERSHQNDEPVTVEHERTVEEKSAVAAAGAAAAKSAGDDSRTTLKKSSDVSGRLAETDYFLNGFIYAVDEAPDEPGAAALRYFRFQFRLTDARSGLVVWENDYEVKKAGALAAAR
ncbi:MAG: hypothetical protein FJ288_07350 [Planctomycetes bacterium]|nr:hypothetical protein [Planctomycetota bacterium]